MPLTRSAAISGVRHSASVFFALRDEPIVRGVVGIATLIVEIPVIAVAMFVLRVRCTVAIQVRVLVISLVEKLMVSGEIQHDHGRTLGLGKVRWQCRKVDCLHYWGNQASNEERSYLADFGGRG